MLHREMVELPSLGIFKIRIDVVHRTWLSGGLVNDMLMDALDYLKGIFQPKQIYAYIVL